MSRLILKQLSILLWKCWIMRRMHIISTLFELFVPLILSFLMAWLLKGIRKKESEEWMGPVIYKLPTMNINLENNNFEALIYYAPSDDFTNALMNRVKSFGNKTIAINGLQNGFKLRSKLQSDLNNKTSINGDRLYGVLFDENRQTSVPPNHFDYTILMSGQMSYHVHDLYQSNENHGPSEEVDDYPDKFCMIQTLINEAYFSAMATYYKKSRNETASVKTFKFPYPKYKTITEPLSEFSPQDFLVFCVVIGYVVMCPLIVKRITDEKAMKAKELLRMMGMNDFVFWGSHFINYFTIMLIQGIVITFLFCVGFGDEPVIQYFDASLFYAILALYFAQSIMFCLLITTIFNKPVPAVIFTVIVYILSFGVPIGILHPSYHKNMDVIATNPQRLLSSIFPNMGIAWAFAIIGRFELSSKSAGWMDLFTETMPYNYMTLGLVMSVMLLSCFLFGFAIFYLDAVWPFQFGVPKPFYFPCLPSYYCPKKANNRDVESVSGKNRIESQNFETEPQTKISIEIKNLRKTFGGYGGEKVAVDNVSLNIYFGQITVLLGHNGAGKTTTMNMITGIFPPTSGSVSVDGFDIVTATDSARRSLGLCPQENIIYDELTVGQHLRLYAILKDFPYALIDSEIDKTLNLLRLIEKKYSLAKSLSGGMKRKLALGIAIIGGTKILILDEPTSSMDPEARRAVWDVLQETRKEKTILLTTHYMEEADVLGDRIAIMSEGKIKCCGSPMFLKNRFGAGYQLRISKGQNFNKASIERTLHKYLPEARLHSEINVEAIYMLESQDPSKPSNKAVFPNLFDELDANKQQFGIDSYGITITTMEDVFLKVGTELEVENNATKNVKSLETSEEKSSIKLKGSELFFQQFFGLFMKRYWPMVLCQIVLPAVLFIFILYCDYLMKNVFKNLTNKLNLELDLYGKTFGFFHSKHEDFDDFGNKFYVPIAEKHDMNTTVLKNDTNPNDWALSHANDLNLYTSKYLIGAALAKQDNNITSMLNIETWYNSEATHSLPISINLIYESLISYFIPDLKNDIKITVTNQPIGLSEESLGFAGIISGLVIICMLLVPITVPFLGASYLLFPIHETVTKAKLLQFMTGLSTTTFWICNFLFDLFNHIIAVIIIFTVFAYFDFSDTFFGQTNTAMGVFIILFLFGFASIPIAYCFSFIFSKPSTGFALLVVMYLLFGLIGNLIMSVLDLLINVFRFDFMSSTLLDIILYICRLIPVFSMCFGIKKLYWMGSMAQWCKQTLKKDPNVCLDDSKEAQNFYYNCCEKRCSPKNECYDSNNPFRFNNAGIGQESICMIASGFLFLAFLWILEGNLKFLYKCKFGKVPKKLDENEDSDVRQERQRIEALSKANKLNEEAIAVIDLTKCFKRLTAVNHLTFGVHKEECFGLLGVNGSGKTTTFQMLTGDLMVDNGNAYINSYELRKDLFSYQKQIGYCPQFDALLDKLTGEELLYLFARLRGLPSSVIPLKVKSLIQMTDLQNDAKKCTETYSGGNRRKLSLALAIIGNPSIIFLDEPTSGVDPSARRKIWSTLDYIKKTYRSAIILTSHSMEESEALCGRIAIMVGGQFRCLGPTQHLRSKFCQGFTVIVKLRRELNDDSGYVSRVQQYMNKEFPSAVLRDSHQCLFHYHITDPSVKWSHIFRVMESAKKEYNFEDYSVSDTSLEQIFITFARTQNQILK